MNDLSRRRLLQSAAAFGAASALPFSAARAADSLAAAIYPGTWDEAYRSVVAPLLAEKHGVDVAFDPLWAVDQVTKARAGRGIAPFDCFVLDPDPRLRRERLIFSSRSMPQCCPTQPTCRMG